MNDTKVDSNTQIQKNSKLVIEKEIPAGQGHQGELIDRGEMMATAESCTGGLIASSIVNEAGSSAILKGGIVAYQNEVKEKLLGVRHETLEQFGAVSEQTVKAMAEGARKNSAASGRSPPPESQGLPGLNPENPSVPYGCVSPIVCKMKLFVKFSQEIGKKCAKKASITCWASYFFC